MNIRSIGQRSRSQGHKLQKRDRVVWVLHSKHLVNSYVSTAQIAFYLCTFSSYHCTFCVSQHGSNALLCCLVIFCHSITKFYTWADPLSCIIGITESWANDHILDVELQIEGYRNIEHKGGGVLLYVRNLLNPSEFRIMVNIFGVVLVDWWLEYATDRQT